MTAPVETALVIPPLRRAWLRELGVPTPWMPAAGAAPVPMVPVVSALPMMSTRPPVAAQVAPSALAGTVAAAPEAPALPASAPNNAVPPAPALPAAEPSSAVPASPVMPAGAESVAAVPAPAGSPTVAPALTGAAGANALARWAGSALRRPVAAQGRLLAGVYEGAGRRWLVVTLAVAPIELQAFTNDAGRLLDQMMRVLGARRGSDAFAAGWRQSGQALVCEPRFWARVEALQLDGMVWLGEPVASIVMAGWQASQPSVVLRDALLLPPLAALMASPAEAKPLAWHALLDSLDAART